MCRALTADAAEFRNRAIGASRQGGSHIRFANAQEKRAWQIAKEFDLGNPWMV